MAKKGWSRATTPTPVKESPPPKAPVPKPAPPPPPPDPAVNLMARCLRWASASAPDGTLDALVADAVEAKRVTTLLDRLPLGGGVTAERLERVRRRLERAEGK